MDTADPTLKRMAEKFGWIKKPKLNPKKLIQAKASNLKELLGNILDNDSESDLNIIVEVVKEPLGIRIRD